MIWLLISVVLLIVLIFFRIDILLVAPIVSVFLCLVSGLDVVDTLAEGFMPAFATFAKNNFLIFMTSAMFARAMQDTGMAASIARGISSKLGPRFAIPCVFFVSALLTYGGVSLFVVVFVVYPIALQLFKEANITRIIIPGAIAAGAFTWAAFCLPGSPQAGPIVATQNLGTNLMVLPWLGVVCAIFMCAMQLVFMNYLHKSAVKKGLGFEADEKTEALISRLDSMKLPNFFISLVPMLVVLITLNVIGLTVYYSMILGVVVALAHEFRVPVDSLPILPMSDRKVIARRAAMELPKNAVINLGIGMPEGVSSVAVEEGFADQLTMTVEAGQIGGVPAAGAAFGGAYNPEFVNDMIRHFDFYDGGGLDVCFLGAAEVDNMGNCNVSKFTRTVGPGGFINIASNTPKCVFCGTLTAGGLKTEIKDGKLVILQEGRNKKYMKHVKQVTFSGENAVKSGQTVLFVTERAVFELDNDGIILTEIAPGIDLQTQVLDMIDFDVRVSPNLKLMDARIFAEGPMGLELK